MVATTVTHDVKPPTEEAPAPPALAPGQFRVYRRRWLVMFVVVLLNLSNAAIWITYAPVATIVQEYYGKYDGEVNYFSVAYLLISMPFAFLSTFIVNRMGLGPAIHLGAALNCVGAVVKALGTAPFVGDSNTQFAISLTGQSIAAMGQPFLLFIPTKVSQIWFPEEQRTISTTIISMSNPLGIVLGEIVTPAIVKEPDDVSLNNYVWAGFAAVCQVCTLFCVTSSKPPTPASLSSEKNDKKEAYWPQLKAVMTCPPYLLLLVMIGFGVAFLSAMATVTQQILCVVGYSTTFSGLATGLLILVGFAGSAAFGVYVDRTKRFTPVCKLCYGCASICGIVMLEFFLVPDAKAWILIFSSLFGFFGVGGYPIGLELAVEATYPVEETISTAFIFLAGQVQGIILIALISVLTDDMKPQFADVEVCTDGSDSIVPKDYSKSIILVMCVLAGLVCILILFFKTPYKRRDAELQTETLVRNPSYSSEVSSTRSRGAENSGQNAAENSGQDVTASRSSTQSIGGKSTEEDGDRASTSTKESATGTVSSAPSVEFNGAGDGTYVKFKGVGDEPFVESKAAGDKPPVKSNVTGESVKANDAGDGTSIKSNGAGDGTSVKSNGAGDGTSVKSNGAGDGTSVKYNGAEDKTKCENVPNVVVVSEKF